MIAAFEQAAQLICDHRLPQARQLVTALPEQVYEKSCRHYDATRHDYFYYLIRFVHDSIDADSVHSTKPSIRASLALYAEMMQLLKATKPTTIRAFGKVTVLE